MNPQTGIGAGLLLGACCLLVAPQAWGVRKCTDEKFLYRETPPASVTRVIDVATRDMSALAYGPAEQKLRLALDELPADSADRLWLYDALASMYLMQKRNADAEQVYRSALTLDLAAGLTHAVQIKLAGALYLSGKDDDLIGLIEAIEKNDCAPVSLQARYWLASAYAAKGRLEDAERVVPKEGKDFKPEAPPELAAHGLYRMLYWRIECALGRAGECARMLATQVPKMEPSPEKARWCDTQVASLARAPEAAAGLQEARAKGAIDAENHCVFARNEPASPYDELIPLERTQARYPSGAARRWQDGSILAKVTVAPDGSVSKVEIVESSPPGIFDEAATTALLKWRFKPKLVNGVTVESTGWQRLDFRMQR